MKKLRHTINVLLLSFLLYLVVYLLFIDVVWEGATLEARHYISILFTLAVLAALFVNHNIFTLLLGLLLTTGNFTGLSSFYTITTSYLGFDIGPLPIPLYWGQPGYSLLLFIYLVFNQDFYTGIATKEYWQGFLNRSRDLESVFTSPGSGKQE